jgi:hypothetical protein
VTGSRRSSNTAASYSMGSGRQSKAAMTSYGSLPTIGVP